MFSIKTALVTLLTSSVAIADVQCNKFTQAPISQAQECVDYVRAKGTQDCVVDASRVEFCRGSKVQLMGSNLLATEVQSSYCSDVADAAQEIIDSCGNDGTVSGYNTAHGNGNLLVSILYNSTAAA
ncbi:hypothetical protein BDW62DRAFT_193438 [Aspergillus aurantiobrunneus]